MDHAVFIQTNHKQITGAIVAEYALRRYSSHNDKFDVHIVDTRDYYWFKSHEGKLYLRDGVKRVWRFIRSLLARAGSGLKALVAWTRDLARLAYRYALASFSAVRRATLSCASAVRFILSSPLPGSDPAHLVIQRDRDLDLTLVLATTHDPAVAGALAATLRRHGQAFHASVHVLSRLIALLMKVITTLTMASGWFGLILALARLFRELRRLAATERSDLELLDTAARAV